MKDPLQTSIEIERMLLSENITVSMEVFQQTGKNETPKPVTITIKVNPFEPWPCSMQVALLHLADENGMFSDYDTFLEFKRQTEELRPIDQMALDWTSLYDKNGDPWKVIKYAFASPKPVVNEPPVSRCPRCGKPLWGSPLDLDKTTLLDLYRHRPSPRYCMKCGQRFKLDGDDDRIAYTASANADQWKKRLAREVDVQQPSLASVA